MSLRAQHALVVQMRSGETHSFVLSEQPRLTFESDVMCVASRGAETRLAMAEIENFHFADQSAAIPAVASDETRFTFIGGQVAVEGCRGPIVMTDAAGRQIHAVSATSDGSCRFDLSVQPAGTYLLRMGRQSVKIFNR